LLDINALVTVFINHGLCLILQTTHQLLPEQKNGVSIADEEQQQR